MNDSEAVTSTVSEDRTINRRFSSRSSMLIEAWILKSVVNDSAAAAAASEAMTDAPPTTSRDNILQQLLDQATSVRRTFEESPSPSKRKHVVSSATSAAALHMASINRKRKFESRLPTSLKGSSDTPASTSGVANVDIIEKKCNSTSQDCFKQARHAFQSPISRYIFSDNDPGQQQIERTSAVVAHVNQMSDVVPKAYPTDLTFNDVVCGSSMTTSSLVGNQRFKVWIKTNKSSFARASSPYDKIQVARSVVNTVMTSVPPGRFFSLDMSTGLRFKLGFNQAVEFVMGALATETTMGEMFKKLVIKKSNEGYGGILKQTDMMVLVD